MDLDRTVKISILSDFNHFNNNLNQIFSLLPYKVEYDFINNIEDIKNKDDIDFIVTNKMKYDLAEINFICEQLKKISILTIIDQNFKSDKLSNNIKNGLIMIRRPLSINSLVEILKVLLISSIKNNKNRFEDNHYKLIDTAKVYLILSKKITEDEAHKYLERYAMSVRINLYKAASIIVSSYLLEREYIEI
jgi:response regulator NasT